MESLKWHTYFMDLARVTANMSKDPNTKVGAVLVKNRRILSIGYNGAPSSFDDNIVPKVSSDDLFKNKNAYVVHAELNAILNYRGNLADFKDSTLYVTVSPCHECAKALIQLGVKTIIYDVKYHRDNITNFSFYLLKTCGVKIMSLEECLNENEGLLKLRDT